jgi:hypothetical protein
MTHTHTHTHTHTNLLSSARKKLGYYPKMVTSDSYAFQIIIRHNPTTKMYVIDVAEKRS